MEGDEKEPPEEPRSRELTADAGPVQRPEVVLEPIARRRRDLGRLRAVPHRRARYVRACAPNRSVGIWPEPAADITVPRTDSNMARDSFATFLPLSVDSDARLKIIFDFFDLLAAIAAHGKTNGFGGRKLSRLAGWWAFSHSDQGDGFDGGYRSWAK